MVTSTLPPPNLRSARRHAPDTVAHMLRDLASIPQLTVLLDLDALERSGTVVIDRVMLLALDGLAKAGVEIVFASTAARDRAMRLRRAMWQPSRLVSVGGDAVAEARRGDAPLLVVTDNQRTLDALAPNDRELALSAGSTAIRASLWYLLHVRTRLP